MSDLELPQRLSMPMWALAAVAAGAIHLAGIALAREYLQRDDPDPEMGPPGIIVGVELVAQRDEPTELPPGPDVDDSIASPALLEQIKVVQPAPLPIETPTETQEPERAVTRAEIKKPEEQKTPIQPVMTSPSVASIAATATARPRSEVIEESTRSVTPAQGTGESSQRVRAKWQKELIAHFDQHKRYPANGSRERVEILVSFAIDEGGHVLSSSIVQGSGDSSFDEAAIAMIRRSDPVPQPPPAVVQEGLSFTLPVIFRAKRGS
jgi:periplasmic protein TonB